MQAHANTCVDLFCFFPQFLPFAPRDILNNQCHLQSNPYPPLQRLRDRKHQLWCQILFRSQNERGMQMREREREREPCACQPGKRTPDLHKFTFTTAKKKEKRKAALFCFFFSFSERKMQARGEGRGTRQKVHNEKCKLCHFSADKKCSDESRRQQRHINLLDVPRAAWKKRHFLPFTGPLSFGKLYSMKPHQVLHTRTRAHTQRHTCMSVRFTR